MHKLHWDLHKIHLIRNEIQEVYLNLIIQSFALSLITIFVPIYLIEVGYSLNQALLFVMVELGTLSFFSPVSALLAKKYGLKHIVLYRMPLLIAYFAGLYMLNSWRVPIYLIALSGGIAASMYWVSLHSLFAKHSDKIHRASQAGKLTSLPGIASLFGPSIGGLIALAFGFKALISISIFLLAVSVIPLFFTGDMKPHVKMFSFRDVFARKYLKFLLAFAAQGVRAVALTIIWPLAVYFAVREITSVGYMATIAALGTITFTFFVGSASDKFDRRFIIKTGSILAAATFLVMVFAGSMTSIFLVSFMAGLFAVMIDIPLIAIFYDSANDGDLVEFIVMREVGLGIGRIAILLVLVFIVNKFTIGLSLAGIASLFSSLF
ncbi:MFS transporter [Candidatus Woesearchaeota archaeon]|nr:MFS transporter [Candidatus Woesearchaeota archaeon]